ncbi:MAG: hypothetical protein JNK28_00900 [Burkholderiaceae bacterium]|nr:hypothetical protein [Burkholderiaceae bacterium]
MTTPMKKNEKESLIKPNSSIVIGFVNLIGFWLKKDEDTTGKSILDRNEQAKEIILEYLETCACKEAHGARLKVLQANGRRDIEIVRTMVYEMVSREHYQDLAEEMYDRVSDVYSSGAR